MYHDGARTQADRALVGACTTGTRSLCVEPVYTETWMFIVVDFLNIIFCNALTAVTDNERGHFLQNVCFVLFIFSFFFSFFLSFFFFLFFPFFLVPASVPRLV